MVLPPEATDRFYRIWFALLHAVNQQLHLVPSLPAEPGTATVPTADALQLRNALWADDALRERFVADNPAGLPPADLELVASWRYRLAGSFVIERYLKQYTVFLSTTRPEHGQLLAPDPVHFRTSGQLFQVRSSRHLGCDGE